MVFVLSKGRPWQPICQRKHFPLAKHGHQIACVQFNASFKPNWQLLKWLYFRVKCEAAVFCLLFSPSGNSLISSLLVVRLHSSCSPVNPISNMFWKASHKSSSLSMPIRFPTPRLTLKGGVCARLDWGGGFHETVSGHGADFKYKSLVCFKRELVVKIWWGEFSC